MNNEISNQQKSNGTKPFVLSCNFFNREIKFEKPNGSIWIKKCNEKDVSGWCYLYKTYDWKLIHVVKL